MMSLVYFLNLKDVAYQINRCIKTHTISKSNDNFSLSTTFLSLNYLIALQLNVLIATKDHQAI